MYANPINIRNHQVFIIKGLGLERKDIMNKT